jgi:hypothetical protein
LGSVAGRLDAAAASARAGQAADALLAAMSKILVVDVKLAEQLNVVCEHRATPDLIPLLGHPLAAGRSQRVVLDVLGRRTRREFRTTWHFLDWAQSNGVDLVPPPPDAVAER